MTRRRAVVAAGGLACALATSAAQADPCSTLPNPMYISAGSIFEPYLRRVGPLLSAATGDDRMTVVYVFTQTCDTVRRLADNAPLTGNGTYFRADGTSTQCEIPAGATADCGVGDLFAATCQALNPAVDASRMRDTPTMVVPMTFVVPVASDQFAISAEEAYFVFGFGAAGMVAPWTDENLIFRRTPTSATQTVIGQNINVPNTRFRGVDGMSTQALLLRVASSPMPRPTIGILGGNEADLNRATVRALAFRAYGQNDYYWPSSRRASFDNRNVRDGHYQPWGYQNFYVRNDAPAGSRGRRFVDFITGARPVPGGDSVDLTIRSGFIPACAMGVRRTANDDGTSIAVHEPAEPCACFYERSVPMGTTACRACTAAADCLGTGVCRRGYCEAR